MDGYYSFINDYDEVIAKGEINEEGHQGPPYYPEIDEIIYNSDEEREANSYDQCIGSEVMLPDNKGEKLMRKISKRIRYDYTSTSEGNYNDMQDKSSYEFEYPDGTTEKLSANIIAEIMMSQVDSEGHHYKVLTEVNDNKKDYSAIANVDGFIK